MEPFPPTLQKSLTEGHRAAKFNKLFLFRRKASFLLIGEGPRLSEK